MNSSEPPPQEKTGKEGGATTSHSDASPKPFVARLVDEDASPIREGSPFRDGSEWASPSDRPVGPSYADLGPMRYTAMGAASAAVLVLVFSGFGAWWFPVGGALVAVLGSLLSIIGLFARRKYRYASIGTLTLHVGLFFLSYVRSLS